MIEEWLDEFKTGWIAKDTEQVLGLFTDDVEYWETPYRRVADKAALEQEWDAVLIQENIRLDLEVFSSVNNRHSVLWKLTYEDENGATQNWAGTYLIELNQSGKCKYFHQTGEKQ